MKFESNRTTTFIIPPNQEAAARNLVVGLVPLVGQIAEDLGYDKEKSLCGFFSEDAVHRCKDMYVENGEVTSEQEKLLEIGLAATDDMLDLFTTKVDVSNLRCKQPAGGTDGQSANGDASLGQVTLRDLDANSDAASTIATRAEEQSHHSQRQLREWERNLQPQPTQQPETTVARLPPQDEPEEMDETEGMDADDPERPRKRDVPEPSVASKSTMGQCQKLLFEQLQLLDQADPDSQADPALIELLDRLTRQSQLAKVKPREPKCPNIPTHTTGAPENEKRAAGGSE